MNNRKVLFLQSLDKLIDRNQAFVNKQASATKYSKDTDEIINNLVNYYNYCENKFYKIHETELKAEKLINICRIFSIPYKQIINLHNEFLNFEAGRKEKDPGSFEFSGILILELICHFHNDNCIINGLLQAIEHFIDFKDTFPQLSEKIKNTFPELSFYFDNYNQIENINEQLIKDFYAGNITA